MLLFGVLSIVLLSSSYLIGGALIALAGIVTIRVTRQYVPLLRDLADYVPYSAVRSCVLVVLVISLLILAGGAVQTGTTPASGASEQAQVTAPVSPQSTPTSIPQEYANYENYDEDDRDVRVYLDDSGSSSSCGSNDGDLGYNEDNDADNDGICDE